MWVGSQRIRNRQQKLWNSNRSELDIIASNCSSRKLVLATGTSYEHPRRAVITSTSNAEHLQDLDARDLLGRISTGPPQDLLTRNRYKIMQGLLRGLHHDLYKVFSQGPVEDLTRSSCQNHYENLTRSWYKDQLLLKRIFLEQLSRKHTKRQSIFQIFIARTSNTSGIVHYLQLATFGTSRYSCDKAGNQECWWRFPWAPLNWVTSGGKFTRDSQEANYHVSLVNFLFPPLTSSQVGQGDVLGTQLGKFSDNMSWFVLMLLEMELAVFDGCSDPEYASANGRDQGLVDYNRRLGPGSLVSSAQHEERDIFNALVLSFMVRMTVIAPGQPYTFHSRLGLVTSSLVFVSVALVLGRSAPV